MRYTKGAGKPAPFFRPQRNARFNVHTPADALWTDPGQDEVLERGAYRFAWTRRSQSTAWETEKRMNASKSSRKYRRRGLAYMQRAAGGFTLVLAHEVGALSGHMAEVRERIAVARKARGLVELLRDQADLLPETRARLALDQRERLTLLNGLIADLRAAA